MTTTTAKPKLTRRARVGLIAAAVLALAGVSILLVNITAGPAPTQYEVSANGNVKATWFSDSDVGTLDLFTGSDVQTVRARSVSVSVDSTLPEGASCRIEGPNGETYVDHVPANTAVHGLAAIVTATCSTSTK